jgi:hypothetical protein
VRHDKDYDIMGLVVETASKQLEQMIDEQVWKFLTEMNATLVPPKREEPIFQPEEPSLRDFLESLKQNVR